MKSNMTMDIYGYFLGENSRLLKMYIGAGMKAPETLQLAAVQEDQYILSYMLYHGLKPSKAVKDAHYVRWEL